MFEAVKEREIALARGPWNIRGSLLVLKKSPPGMSWQELDLFSTSMWVQIHGIPLGGAVPDKIHRMRSLIGPVLECDFPKHRLLVFTNYPRVKVEVDTWKPLIPRCLWPRKNQAPAFISFRYERLSMFCLLCGRLNHSKTFCSIPVTNQLPEGTFGEELRVDGARIRRYSRSLDQGKTKLFKFGDDCTSGQGYVPNTFSKRTSGVQNKTFQNLVQKNVNWNLAQNVIIPSESEGSSTEKAPYGADEVVGGGPLSFGVQMINNMERVSAGVKQCGKSLVSKDFQYQRINFMTDLETGDHVKFITEEPIINALVTVDPIPYTFSQISLENISLESRLDDEVDIRGSFIEELLEQVGLVIKEKVFSKFEELVVEAQLQSNTSSLENDVG